MVALAQPQPFHTPRSKKGRHLLTLVPPPPPKLTRAEQDAALARVTRPRRSPLELVELPSGIAVPRRELARPDLRAVLQAQGYGAGRGYGTGYGAPFHAGYDGSDGASGGSGGGGLDAFSDDFDGTNGDPLDATKWYTSGAAASITVQQQDGRYWAYVTNEVDSLWYTTSEGRGDWMLVDVSGGPADFVAYNVGVGLYTLGSPDTWDSQAPIVPSVSPYGASPYAFGGVSVHVADAGANPENALDGTDQSYRHFVVGHRGGQYYTLEAKNNNLGSSNVVDEGFNVLSGVTRADVRVIITDNSGDVTVDFYWRTATTTPATQIPGPLAGWTASSHTAFTLPTHVASRAYVGLVSYLFDDFATPHILGTCDKWERVS